jgi:hypothetical protein
VRASVFAGLLALATAVAGRAAASTNHVRNSHFGTGTKYWTTAVEQGMGFGWTSSEGHTAPGAAIIETDATQRDVVALRQCVGVKENVSYAFGGAFLYKSGNGTAARARVAVQWHTGNDCSGNLLSQYDQTPESGVSGALADTWQVLSSSAIAPAGAVTATIQAVFITDAAATAYGLYDDIHLRGGLSGDVDASGVRDVNDVFYLINFLFAGGPLPVGPADVDNSDDLDVADVFYLINFLFANGPAPL